LRFELNIVYEYVITDYYRLSRHAFK
jgi:hypothetical protein